MNEEKTNEKSGKLLEYFTCSLSSISFQLLFFNLGVSDIIVDRLNFMVVSINIYSVTAVYKG